MRKREFEYMEVRINPSNHNNKQKLDDYGNDGWELISMVPIIGAISHGTMYIIAYFKREIIPDGEGV